MTEYRHVKHCAKQALKGHWGKALLCGLLFVLTAAGAAAAEWFCYTALANSAVSSQLEQIAWLADWLDTGRWQAAAHLLAAGAIGFLQWLVLAPLWFGLSRWSLAVMAEQKAPFGLVFFCFASFRDYRRSVAIAWSAWFRTLGVSLLSLLPAAFLFGVGEWYRTSPAYHWSSYWLLIAVCLLLALCGAAVIGIVALQYSFLPYFYLQSPRDKNRALFARCRRWIKQVRFGTLSFALRFVFWFLLCLFWLPQAFVLPYWSVSQAFWQGYTVKIHKKEQKSSSQSTNFRDSALQSN